MSVCIPRWELFIYKCVQFSYNGSVKGYSVPDVICPWFEFEMFHLYSEALLPWRTSIKPVVFPFSQLERTNTVAASHGSPSPFIHSANYLIFFLL